MAEVALRRDAVVPPFVPSQKMMQTRICSYFQHRCVHGSSSPITFFSLPDTIRDKIYQESEVSTEDGRPTSLRLIGYKTWPACYKTDANIILRDGDGIPWLCAPSDTWEHDMQIFSLSLTSHAVADDILRYLLACREVLLCCHDYADLTSFLDMPDRFLNTLTHLTIHFEVSHIYLDCVGVETCCHRDKPPRSYYRSRRYRLNNEIPLTDWLQSVLYVWRRTVDRLASFPNVADLRLDILYETEPALFDFLEPLSRLRLTDSHIRLGVEKSDVHLRNRARRIVEQITGFKEKVFPFRKLPSEIQTHILGFTDLVTPLREVYVSELGWFYHRFMDTDCSSSPSQPEFCSRNFPVYPDCECWKEPSSLFLVSKDIRKQAVEVFFSRNRFLIREDADSTRPFVASTFLTKRAQEGALHYLRQLELIMPFRLYDFSNQDRHVLENWEQTVERVAPYLKKLSVRLYFGKGLAERISEDEGSLLHERDPDLERRMLAVHERIVRPLRKWRGLDDFFVGWEPPPAYHNPEIDESEEMRAWERHLERVVMGEGYDSVARGKDEVEKSQWQIWRE